ncbi:MAG: flagellar hook-basal body protein [Syntrophorhabdaceae bacterium]|nr:flagellar hook-basal body protein [Syntrophorhabdaceae bacterium]
MPSPESFSSLKLRLSVFTRGKPPSFTVFHDGIKIAFITAMYKGIYIALSGSIQKQNQIDTITHNVANVSTIGFKKSRISFHEHMISRISGMADSDDGKSMTHITEIRTDYSPGAHFTTGNPLDVALVGNGFLSLEGDRYTRSGALLLDREGYLVTTTGRRVLGAAGPIQIPPDGKPLISPDGQVSSNGVVIGALRIVDFADTTSLVALSNGEFRSADAPIASNASVAAGYLEAANVEAVKEMVEMINTVREFEIYQKAIRIFDDAASRVNSEMAKV